MKAKTPGFRLNRAGIGIMAPMLNKQTIFLMYLLTEIDEEGKINLNPAIKLRLFSKIGSNSTNPASAVTKYLAMYCKADIMTSMGGGEYYINPLVAAKYKDFAAAVISDSQDYMEYKAQTGKGPLVNIVKVEGNNYGNE